MKTLLFAFIFSYIFILPTYSQEVYFSSIPKEGTIIVFAHQDDDFLWWLPFWSKCEKFICGAMPADPFFETAIHNQQIFLDTNNYDINYESNWIHPFADITHQEYFEYYWHSNQAYNYLANDHIIDLFDYDYDSVTSRIEINKMKAKLEFYIADPNTSRIITHNSWGEYGHPHHKALSKAVRELVVKYHKDVWILGDSVDGDSNSPGYQTYKEVSVPAGITYSYGNVDPTLYDGLVNNYKKNYIFTWWGPFNPYSPSLSHKFIKIVDEGIDKTSVLTGEPVDSLGPARGKPDAYIFDGIDDYLTLPGNNYPSFTIAMWVRPDVIMETGISGITEYPSSGSGDRSFYIGSDAKVKAQVFDGQMKTASSQSQLSEGNWAHILMTGNGISLKIYFNGTLEGEIAAGPVYTQYSTPEFVIGHSEGIPSSFEGQVSDARLYDYVLNQDEITAVSSASPPVTHTITASAGDGGAISPIGAVTINDGSNHTFTIIADNFYQISDVVVDNISVGAVSSYTFTNIIANHTIVATFKTLPSLALNKPSSCSSVNWNNWGLHGPDKSNDEDASNNSYWVASFYPYHDADPPDSSYRDPIWIVDLENNYELSKIVIRNFVDSYNYFKYAIWASIDNVSFTKIAEKTNSSVATNAGDSYDVAVAARYLKVITSYGTNYEAYISDFRAYGTPVTYIWTGATNSDWHTITNWDGEVVPGSSGNVEIPVVASSNYPVISASAVCKNLTIVAPANLEIASAGSLVVNGTLTNYAGNAGLVIKSDASGTGSLIENSGAAATVERYIKNDWHWHLLSSPVGNQVIWPQFAQSPSLNGSTYQFPASPWYWDFYYFNPMLPSTGHSWVNLRKNSAGEYNDGSVDASNNNAGFKDATNTFPTEFERGKGYLVAYNNGWTAGSPETHMFSGSLNTGTITKTLKNNVNGSAFNLVGNPYSSSIDWDLADDVTSWGRSGALAVSGEGYDYWVWDDAYGQYRYHNSFSHLGNAGRYIEPGQGFFVQAAANPTDLTFRNGIRTQNSDKGWFKSIPTELNTIRLKLSNNANSFFDEMLVDFNSNYTGLEGTQKIGSLYTEVPEIYSVKGGTNYSIDRYQQISNNLTVNICAKCGKQAIYTLTATNITGFQLSNKVYLEDMKTGIKINLKENHSYSFAGEPNDTPSRFKVSFAETIGINEPEVLNQVYIYSFGKDVYINTTLPNIGTCDLFIYNSIGLVVHQSRFAPSSGNNKFTTLSLPGIYIVKAISHLGTNSAKIIIK